MIYWQRWSTVGKRKDGRDTALRDCFVGIENERYTFAGVEVVRLPISMR